MCSVQGGIQQLIDDLAARLQRSVVVDDPGVKPLYTSPHYGDEDDARRRAVLQRDAGRDVVGYVLAQGVTSWRTAGTIPANPDLGLDRRACLPVRWRGTLVGLLIVMDRDSTLTADELVQLEEVADLVAPLLAGEQHARRRAVEEEVADTVRDLVGDAPAVRRAAAAALGARTGIDPDTDVRVVTVRAVDTDGAADTLHVTAAIESALAAELPPTRRLFAALDAGRAILLVEDRTWPEDALIEWANRLLEQADATAGDRFRCVAGLGAPASGLARAHLSHRQATVAVRGCLTVVPGRVARWTELGAHALLLQVPRGLGRDLLPDEVRRLLEADRDGRTVETVRAYLDHGGSVPATAAALHLHRTTLYYRLERARDATGLDLEDGATRLALHAGLRLLDVEPLRLL